MATDNMTDNKCDLLIRAVIQRNENDICALVDAGVDVNITGCGGQTALFYAVQQSNKESVVRALINAGADINMTGDDGQTALSYAAQQNNNESVVRALISAGADVNMTGEYGRTALFYAAQQSNNDSVIHALIDAGADVNRTYFHGRTALFYAVQRSNNESTVRALIYVGADFNITDIDNQTALIHAIQLSNESVVRVLIDAGADVNIINNYGQTALLYALRQSNNKSVVCALIDAGADVNITDVHGQNALFYAVQQSINNESVVRALIDAGADVNITNDYGQTPLFVAVRLSNNESVVCALIDAGADVNITTECGQTPLFVAVQQSNNESVVCALIDAGADVNKTDGDGQTALFYAVQQSNNEIVVRVLIDAGADVNISDNYGYDHTALFYAFRQSNNESVVRELIDAGGAFVHFRDVFGRTPLFYALNYPKSARILVDKGKKYLFHLKDNSNCSILNFFVDRNVFYGNTNILPGFFDLLEECEVQKKTFAEAILNIAFCKLPLIFLKRPGGLESMRTVITRALELAGQYIDNQKEIQMLITLVNENCKNGEGASQALQSLVELGADPNSVDQDGNTAFHCVTRLAFKGVVPQEIVMEICLQLEKLGVPLNFRNHEYQTPLLQCLRRNDGESVSLEEKRLSEVKTQVEICRFLSKHGSSIEGRSRMGETFFHLLLNLFQEGLDLNDMTVRQDVLHEAIKLLQFFSPEKVTNAGIINISHVSNNSTVMHLWASLHLPPPQDYASNVTRDLTFEQFLQTILSYLLRCGAKLDARNWVGRTPLLWCRTWIALKLLLDAGAKANDVDSSEASPLVAAALSSYGNKPGPYPDVSDLDPKAFWKTAIDKGLDPWTADKDGKSVLSICIERNYFVFAKALVDVACEQGYTRSETFAVGLLNAICKDKSTRTNWKSILVKDILKARRVPTTASEPLRLCCRNIIETGVLDNKIEKKSASAAKEMSASKDHVTFAERQHQSSKGRMNTLDNSIEAEFENSSVHCEIIKILRLYGADGNSCLDMVDTSDALKELLTNALDSSEVSVLIPWTSISKKYKAKLAKVTRRQECDVIHEDFWCHKEHVGSGSYGNVFVGINQKDGREVAIKCILKTRMQRPEDKREIKNLTVLADCEQTVRYLNFFEDETFSCIVLELMEGNLDEYLIDKSTFDSSKSTQLCQDVVKGLKFLHAENIIHRDLKPGNILYKIHPDLRLKIADFGLSCRDDSSTTTVYSANAGTRCWMAPELLMGTHVHGGDHSKASDMFSCGLVLHYILSKRKHPFSPCDCASKGEYQIAHETEANIMKGSMEGWDKSILVEATHLIEKMLECDKDKRPTAEKSLDHPLFWSNQKKVDVLVAVGNQSEFECPRAKRSTLTAVEIDLEKNFSSIVVHGKWDDSRYMNMPTIYTEMTSTKRKSYDTHSVIELVRFIRNAYAHVSESTRPTTIRKMLLEDFVFLEYFCHLVMEVYKVVTDHGWDQRREEIEYAMNK
ncbi:uncharacterized protein LOC116304984 [Actinia tenebrosa]|uniref:Uncharacterized protein LOC116304984 n=1 Tax=Actinia tenebrosa TaxID=6105 RepID=A0A6P8ITT4_ACTTE|nr:uncharacterized protein LOC116304984 [Actinia tenebrosa]